MIMGLSKKTINIPFFCFCKVVKGRADNWQGGFRSVCGVSSAVDDLDDQVRTILELSTEGK